MLRAYERFRKINSDAGDPISLHAARDVADDFFNHCYHFKDWLKRDPAIPELGVEDFINNSQSLSLAADYCNSSKHGGAGRNPKSGKKIEEANVHTTLNLTAKGFVNSSRLEIIIDGKAYDAFSLASECMKEWDIFLSANKIKLL